VEHLDLVGHLEVQAQVAHLEVLDHLEQEELLERVEHQEHLDFLAINIKQYQQHY